MLTFTFDLEDHTPPHVDARHGLMTETVLAWLAENDARATVFVVGELAAREPGLVARIAAAGHEVGVHGWRHVALQDVGEQAVGEELRRAKAAVEDATGAPADGYRAPIFSLTQRTPWAPDALREAGFSYSSSVLPARSPLHGLPGAPVVPCRWENGLLELPCPVTRLGPGSVPFLGGVYLRYLPLAFARRAQRGLASETVAWTYIHPYDLDPDEPFYVMEHAGWLTSRILHARRRGTLERVRRLAQAVGGFGAPLATIAATLADATLPTVRP